jgi:hypothetical protein
MPRQCTNQSRQVVLAIKFCTVAPNICRCSVWNLLHVTLVALTILRRSLKFRKYLCTVDTRLNVYTHTHTNLLTPWSRVLLEKLTVNFAASQEIPRIYGT